MTGTFLSTYYFSQDAGATVSHCMDQAFLETWRLIVYLDHHSDFDRGRRPLGSGPGLHQAGPRYALAIYIESHLSR